MNGLSRTAPWPGHRVTAWLMAAGMVAFGPLSARAAQQSDRAMLTARMSRWQGDPAKKRKGPPGFDIQFRLVGSRFDGTFGVEGVPQSVPEGEPFDAQVKLTNIGAKQIKVSSVTVTGEGLTLVTDLLAKRVQPKSAATVASFKVPAQSSAGSAFLITVVLSNGDRHRATLRFSRPS